MIASIILQYDNRQQTIDNMTTDNMSIPETYETPVLLPDLPPVPKDQLEYRNDVSSKVKFGGAAQNSKEKPRNSKFYNLRLIGY